MKGYTEYRIRRRAKEVKQQLIEASPLFIMLLLAWVLVQGQEVILKILGGVW